MTTLYFLILGAADSIPPDAVTTILAGLLLLLIGAAAGSALQVHQFERQADEEQAHAARHLAKSGRRPFGYVQRDGVVY